MIKSLFTKKLSQYWEILNKFNYPVVKILVLFFACFVLLFLVQKSSNYWLENRTSYELPTGIDVTDRSLILPRLNGDGRNYLDIAMKGYFIKGIYNLRAFFPLFPLILSLVSRLSHLNIIYSGLLLTNLITICSAFALYKIVKLKTTKNTALKAVLLLFTFPVSYFLFSFYPESLYLLLSLLVFWYLNKKNFLLATVFAALASATRIVGIVLSFMVVLEGFKYYLKHRKFPYIVLGSPLGIVGYSIYSYFTTGDLFIYFHSWPVWGKSFSLLGPINAFLNGFHNVIIGPQSYYDSPYVYVISIFEFVTLLFLIFIIIKSFNKIKIEYWIYLVLSSYICLSGGILQSLPRYLLVLFPIYIYLAKNLKSVLFIIFNFISVSLLIFLSSLFFRGYWVS